MFEAGASYERLLAESEQLAHTLSADDWDGFVECLDRRQGVLDNMRRAGEPSAAEGDVAETTALIDKILAVERTVSGLVQAQMAGISTGALGRRQALEAYADRSDASPG